jgi:hypothetical protein
LVIRARRLSLGASNQLAPHIITSAQALKKFSHA